MEDSYDYIGRDLERAFYEIIAIALVVGIGIGTLATILVRRGRGERANA